MSKEDNAGFRGFLMLGVFMAIISGLLYVVIVGIGPDWVRLIIAMCLMTVVLVIATRGWWRILSGSGE